MSLLLVKKYTTHSAEFRGNYKGDRAFSGECYGAIKGIAEVPLSYSREYAS